MSVRLPGRLRASVCAAILAALAMVAAAGDKGLVTTWRGPTYQGVMPASDLVGQFVWYDKDAPPVGEVRPWLLDPKLPGTMKPRPEMPYKPGARVNACWRVPLPSWGHSSPVVVGNKVFVTCDAVPSTGGKHVLVCVDVPSGRLEWVKPVDHLLAWDDAEKVEQMQKIRMAEVNGWAEAMRRWNAIYWDNEKDCWFGGGGDAWRDRLKGGRPGKLAPERRKLLDRARAAGYRRMGPDGYWRHTGRYGNPERREQYRKACRTRARVYAHNKDFPWYGSTYASPVGDGTAVYAVAAPDAVACYELDGTLRWAADMEVGPRPKGSGLMTGIHRNIASPVLADGKLVYFNTNGICVLAYDTATGEQVWRTGLPRQVETKGHPQGGWWPFETLPRGYAGHMGPGGTPVPMTLRDSESRQRIPVVVIPNGHVLRAADGKVLGWFDSFRRERDVNRAQTYGTGVAVGDIYVSVHSVATRLSLEGGRLRSERLWARRGGRKPAHKGDTSLIANNAEVFASRGEAWDLLTGKTLRSGIKMRGSHGKVSGCLSADGLMVWRGGEYGNHAITFGLGETKNPREHPEIRGGYGLIVEGSYPQNIRQNFIDRFGKSRIHLGWSHPTAFGNRIFVRTNAYLYCFGKGRWRPPAAVAAGPGQ